MIKGEIPPRRKVYFLMKTIHTVCISILFAIFTLTSGLIIYIIVLGITHQNLGSGTQGASLSAGYDTEESLPDELYGSYYAADEIEETYLSSDTTQAQGENSAETVSYGGTSPYEEIASYEETTSYEGAAYSGADYVNDWMGIKFTAPAGYAMLTNEEIAELAEVVTDLVSTDLDSSEPEYDGIATESNLEMMCSSPTGIPNVNVNIITVPPSIALNEYIEAYMSYVWDLSNIDLTTGDTLENVTVAGKEFAKFHGTINITSFDNVIKEQDYYFAQNGNRLFVICLTYLKEEADAAAVLMSGFQAK